jgi:hypothetical protein
MIGHPNFPRTELRHLATAPVAADRALAILDPGTAPETIEALSHDPENPASDEPPPATPGSAALVS